MKEAVRKTIKTQKYLNALLYILYNLRIRSRLLFNVLSTDSGTTHSDLSVKESTDYIENVFKDYLRVSGKSSFKGRVAELGPGDSAGVGLMFLAHGAEHVDLADRFYSKRSHTQQVKIYEALGNAYPNVKKILSQGDLSSEESIPGITRFYGEDASGEKFFEGHKGYDVIVSRSVLEHVDDPEGALRKMYEALNPGGVLIHKVDLRDHEMFTPYSHSLKFLEISQWLYKLMTYGAGYPNRFLFDQYNNVLKDLDPACRFYVAGLHGVGTLPQEYPVDEIPTTLTEKAIEFVKKHRSKFSAPFKKIPAEDLMISSFFFVCERR